MRGNSTGEVHEGLCRKLEEEKNQEDRRTLKLRKKIPEREIAFEEGTGGLDRHIYMGLLMRDEGYRRERDGVVLGLEAAIDLVEQAEEEQGQQAPPPRSSTHPGRPVPGRTPEDQKSGGTPQNRQSTEEGKGLLAGHEEGGNDLNKALHKGPNTGQIRENSQDAEPSRGAQEDTPTLEDSQAPGQPPPKEL